MVENNRRLRASGGPLVSTYDCAMLDLDGVVYVGPEPVPGVPELLEKARQRHLTLAFVTNNASRTPEQVAEHLRQLNIAADASDVVTSAQAAARVAADRLPPGARVLVIGGDGLVAALRERGLEPVRWEPTTSRLEPSGATPIAVVQGFHPSVGWEQLAYGAHAVRASELWVASNLDLTIPTARGAAPGNGTLVNAVAAAAGRRPDVVAGKPFRPLFDETVRRTGSAKPLVVGDRLDTDMEGAARCGAHSLLVLTGVTDLRAAVLAKGGQRPDYVSATLTGLMATHEVPEYVEGRAMLGGWVTEVRDDEMIIHRHGDDTDDGVRAVVSVGWRWLDDHPEAQLRLDSIQGFPAA
ncbi:MAG: HAD-IIA family hydrolase [Nocardioidaceae bacterium]|nr:HAD-IIA family hydrolase [Nocardioidaceae bacterium]